MKLSPIFKARLSISKSFYKNLEYFIYIYLNEKSKREKKLWISYVFVS
jgi:hypothetical protein